MRDHEQDNLEARTTADQWHGGQDSALYAFASTGQIEDYERLRAEVHGCRRYAGEEQRRKLAHLLRVCEAQHKAQSRELANSLMSVTGRPLPGTIDPTDPDALESDKARITSDLKAAQGLHFNVYLSFTNHYARVINELAKAYTLPKTAQVKLVRHADHVIQTQD